MALGPPIERVTAQVVELPAMTHEPAHERDSSIDQARRDIDEDVTGPSIDISERLAERHGVIERHDPFLVRRVDVPPRFEEEHVRLVAEGVYGPEARCRINSSPDRVHDAIRNAAVEEHPLTRCTCRLVLLDRPL